MPPCGRFALRVPLEKQIRAEEAEFVRHFFQGDGVIIMVEVHPGIESGVGEVALENPQQVCSEPVRGVALPVPRSVKRLRASGGDGGIR